MNLAQTDDLRITSIAHVINPDELIARIPVTEQAVRTTVTTRRAIHDILAGRDDRILVIAGPCSIHDTAAALDYAKRLVPLIEQHRADLLLVMRVYFEKPRTTVGWKGLINDPDLNDTFDINKGLALARQLLLDLNDMGVPAGTEYLDIITPQYVADLISWGAIGARTTESQVHRELSSGLSCPVGLKNGTNGNLDIAVDGIRAASRPHHFLSLTKAGHSAIYTTAGNEDCHIILRGGKDPELRRGERQRGQRETARRGAGAAPDDRFQPRQQQKDSAESGQRVRARGLADYPWRAAHHRRNDRKPSGSGPSGSGRRQTPGLWAEHHRRLH